MIDKTLCLHHAYQDAIDHDIDLYFEKESYKFALLNHVFISLNDSLTEDSVLFQEYFNCPFYLKIKKAIINISQRNKKQQTIGEDRPLYMNLFSTALIMSKSIFSVIAGTEYTKEVNFGFDINDLLNHQ